MTAVRISGTFKKDERPYNGLEAIAKLLLNHDLAGEEYTIVARVRAHAARWTADDGEEIPTAKLTRIEVVDGDDAAAVNIMMAQRYQARTGRDEQPELPLAGDAPDEDRPNSDRQRDEWLDDGKGK